MVLYIHTLGHQRPWRPEAALRKYFLSECLRPWADVFTLDAETAEEEFSLMWTGNSRSLPNARKHSAQKCAGLPCGYPDGDNQQGALTCEPSVATSEKRCNYHKLPAGGAAETRLESVNICQPLTTPNPGLGKPMTFDILPKKTKKNSDFLLSSSSRGSFIRTGSTSSASSTSSDR